MDCLYSYELGLEGRLAVLEEHADNFLEVALELIERLTLTVSPRPARDVPYKKPRIRIAFDYDVEASHPPLPQRRILVSEDTRPPPGRLNTGVHRPALDERRVHHVAEGQVALLEPDLWLQRLVSRQLSSSRSSRRSSEKS